MTNPKINRDLSSPTKETYEVQHDKTLSDCKGNDIYEHIKLLNDFNVFCPKVND